MHQNNDERSIQITTHVKDLSQLPPEQTVVGGSRYHTANLQSVSSHCGIDDNERAGQVIKKKVVVFRQITVPMDVGTTHHAAIRLEAGSARALLWTRIGEGVSLFQPTSSSAA